MSKKKYNYEYGKEVGCNKTLGWLLSTEEIALVRYYLFLAGLEFKQDAKKNLRENAPKNYILHEMWKYREVTSLYADLSKLMPHVYERV